MDSLGMFYLMSCGAHLFRIAVMPVHGASVSNVISSPWWLPLSVITQLSKIGILGALDWLIVLATLAASVQPEAWAVRAVCAAYMCACIPNFCVTGHNGELHRPYAPCSLSAASCGRCVSRRLHGPDGSLLTSRTWQVFSGLCTFIWLLPSFQRLGVQVLPWSSSCTCTSLLVT